MAGQQEGAIFPPHLFTNSGSYIFCLSPYSSLSSFVCAAQDFLSSAALVGPSLNKALCASSRARLSFQVGAYNWPLLTCASCMRVLPLGAIVLVIQSLTLSGCMSVLALAVVVVVMACVPVACLQLGSASSCRNNYLMLLLSHIYLNMAYTV